MLTQGTVVEILEDQGNFLKVSQGGDVGVNRPANVPQTLAEAVNQFITSTGKNDPTTWTDADELNVLNIYIARRANTSMTDSTDRANRIRQAVANGLASDKRGSFQP